MNLQRKIKIQKQFFVQVNLMSYYSLTHLHTHTAQYITCFLLTPLIYLYLLLLFTVSFHQVLSSSSILIQYRSKFFSKSTTYRNMKPSVIYSNPSLPWISILRTAIAHFITNCFTLTLFHFLFYLPRYFISFLKTSLHYTSPLSLTKTKKTG